MLDLNSFSKGSISVAGINMAKRHSQNFARNVGVLIVWAWATHWLILQTESVQFTLSLLNSSIKYIEFRLGKNRFIKVLCTT